MSKLKFTRRPSPVLPEHRPLFKTAQILMILHCSRGGKSSIVRLNLFNWALKSKERMDFLQSAISSGQLALPTWGFDPALAIALRFVAAERLIVQVPNGYQLEPSGEKFITKILEDKSIFSEEEAFLTAVGKGITEKMVEAIASNWD